MGILRRLISSWRFRRKTLVTPDEFIVAMEDDLGRKLDANSTLFFRHHPLTVALIHRILNGQICDDGGEGRVLVTTTFLQEMAEYCVGLNPTVLHTATPLADVLEEFQKLYPDAGNVIGQAAIRYLKAR